MARQLGRGELARLERMGAGAMPTELGLGLFDEALGSDAALLAPVRLDIAALRAQARTGALPSVLRGLAPYRSGRWRPRRRPCATGWPESPPTIGSTSSWTWSAGTWRPSSDTPPPRPSIPNAPSRTSASTRSVPWICGTG
ncbi:hypothetical protein NKH77_43920 [Streptomyces sp. M19]